MSSGVELDPCPWCGSKDIDLNSDFRDGGLRIFKGYCNNCGAAGPCAAMTRDGSRLLIAEEAKGYQNEEDFTVGKTWKELWNNE